ncbi:MAG TPA: hypothetical protein VGR47_06350 [Terracidiphilus sp.]|nr:hypothetical protein [Terracidiphilus sp.]
MSVWHYLRAGGAALLAVSAALALAQNSNQKSDDSQNQSQTMQDQSRSGQTPMTLNPDLEGLKKNHRLILKDGSYQVVTQYKIVGDRVRYFSRERNDWEEIPTNMVDWDATRKWEQKFNPPSADEMSPGMKEAAKLDDEETEERADQKARMPEVSKGLNLPDEDGVFALDTFHGTPELVPISPDNIDLGAKAHHGISSLSPMAGARSRLELDGEHAKVHLHVNEPTFFLSLDTPHAADAKEPVLSNPITVKTVSQEAIAGRKYGAHSAASRFAVVHLDERIAMRFVGPVEVSQSGTVVGDPNVIPAKVQALPGGRWLRVQPERPLLIGEYALVEILSPTEMSPSVWDFQVNPATEDNPGSMSPILGSNSNPQ